MKEQWKETEFKGYFVSNMGRIKNKNTHHGNCKSLMSGTMKKGYRFCTINNKPIRVCRIVAKAFVAGNNDLTVNHKNGDKADDRAENLEWLSIKDNIHHARDVLGAYRGTNNGRAKLSIEDVIEIRLLLMSSMSSVKIAQLKHVSPAQIGHIKNKRSWSHL